MKFHEILSEEQAGFSPGRRTIDPNNRSDVHVKVEDFVYLGGLISSTGSSQSDVIIMSVEESGLQLYAVRRLAKYGRQGNQ